MELEEIRARVLTIEEGQRCRDAAQQALERLPSTPINPDKERLALYGGVLERIAGFKEECRSVADSAEFLELAQELAEEALRAREVVS